jgi:UDP-N-acetylmuramate: L-alanyl-gamma-D-glutamyl-meso-diaminopimelate ligase
MGWFPNKIHKDLDAIILGMHARIDNPELLRAQELNIPIFSYPEYIYEQSKTKKRVVIGGSHGKTSITAMVLHVLNYMQLDCDFMVGAQLEGFDTMVKLTKEAPIIILEGDEYLSSPIDRRPKFHWYKPSYCSIEWYCLGITSTYFQHLKTTLSSSGYLKRMLKRC